jgi:hypothetical protein
LPWLFAVTGGFLACGLLDDLSPQSAALKFALQLLLPLACSMPLLPPDVRGNVVVLAGLLFSLVYFVNAWNFMDGSNGMITLQALVIALAVGTWPGQDAGLALAALALAGACLGFLPWNFPRARVFLGDAGSLLLGSAVFLLLLASVAVGAMRLVEVLLLGQRLPAGHRPDPGSPGPAREALLAGAPRAPVPICCPQGPLPRENRPGLRAATGGLWLLARILRENHSKIVIIATPLIVWGCAAAAYVLLRRHWLRRGRGSMGVRE